ncbi:MAG: gliding motility-associated C-terminal domain-containing protein [Bacteroidota bacterium]
MINFCCETKSQVNLIPNGSFENYKSCYVNSGTITYNAAIFDSLYNWFIPVGGGSTDYFNKCSDITWSFAVPSSVQGFQYPRTGNGFIGFAPYAKDAFFNTLAHVKEYARVKLNTKLQANTKYCLQFYASLSDSSNYKTNTIQGLFTQSDTSIFNEDIASALAQITIKKKYSDIQIGQWQLWEGDFIAQGKEEYFTLGDFRNDSVIDTLFVANYHYPTYFNYYFIDDVQLYKCDESEINIPNIFTPNKDGINDEWAVEYNELMVLFIYNRWGNLLIQQSGYKINWNGNDYSSGVYYYLIKTETKIYKGYIQLMR